MSNSRNVNYRHWLEYPVLIGTIFFIIGILIFTGLFSAGTLSVMFLIILAISYFRNRHAFSQYVRQSELVDESNYPEIKRMMDECLEHIDAPRDTQCYIMNADILNAYAIGFNKPFKIILARPLLDYFDRDELKSVIGHELGHIRYGHTFWSLITGAFENQSYSSFFLGTLVRFLFLFHSRICEYTADRSGLIACGNLQKAVSAELKLHMPASKAQKKLQEIIARGDTADDTISEDLMELTSTHPTMKGRIKQILDFAKSGAFRTARPDARGLLT